MKTVIILILFVLSWLYLEAYEIKLINEMNSDYWCYLENSKGNFQFGDSIIFYAFVDKKEGIEAGRLSVLCLHKNKITEIGSIVKLNGNNNFYNSGLIAFVKDKGNNFWIGMNNSGLHKLNASGELISYNWLLKENGINEFNSILNDEEDNLWLHGNVRIFKWNGAKIEKVVDNNADRKLTPAFGVQNTLCKIKNRIYFLSMDNTLAFYNINEKKVDSVCFKQFINKCNLNISNYYLKNNKIYFTYKLDTITHFASYDGENLTDLDHYFSLINNDFFQKYNFALAVDQSKTIYFHFVSSYEPFTHTLSDTIYSIDTNLITRKYLYKYLLKNAFTLKNVFNLSTGELLLPVQGEGFLVITNPTSVETPTNHMFMKRVYPNPAEETFSVDFAVEPVNLLKMKIELYDFLGRSHGNLNPEIIYDSSTGKGTMKCDASFFPKGMYIITLSNGTYKQAMNLFLN